MRDGRVCVRVRGVAPRGCSRRGSHRSGACAHDAVVNGVCQGATSQGTARRPCVTLLAAPRRLPPPRRELGAPAVPARPAPGSQAPLPPSAALSQERATSVQLWLRRRGWARRSADARFEAAGGVRCSSRRPERARPHDCDAACASRTRSLAARRRGEDGRTSHLFGKTADITGYAPCCGWASLATRRARRARWAPCEAPLVLVGAHL